MQREKELYSMKEQNDILMPVGDYGAPGSISKENAYGLIEQTKEFIDSVEKHLRKLGYKL